MAFTGYKALDFSGIDKAIQGFQQRQQLASLGQNLDGTPEGYAKAAQALLQRGDTAAAANFFALGEKARERSLTETATRESPFNMNRRVPTAPTVQGVAPVTSLGATSGAGRASPAGVAVAETPDATANFEAQASGLTQLGNANEPRGLRNNNPGNIESGRFAATVQGFQGSDGRFAQYATPEQGIQAADKLLTSYAGRGLNTVNGIVNRWAPPTENNTGAYVAQVAKELGVDPNQPLDMNNWEVRQKLIAAKIRVENGKQPYAEDVFQRALNPNWGREVAAFEGGAQPTQAAQAGPQFALGSAPPPSDQFTPAQQPTQVAQAPQPAPAPGGDGLYSNTPTPALQAFINNPRVPDNLRALMQQELAKRGGGAPAAPVQLAQAPAQPGAPVSDVPAQGGAEVQGNFTIPGPNRIPPTDLFPQVPTQDLIPLIRNTKHPDHALAVQIYKERQAYSSESAPEKLEQTRLATEKARLELEQLRANANTPEGVREFVYARREGMTKARTPAEYAAEKAAALRGPVALGEGQRLIGQNGEIIVGAGPSKADREITERTAIADRQGLQGDAREAYILNGRVPVGAEKTTEGQANAALYADRMKEAEAVFARPGITEASMSRFQQGLARVPAFGNSLVSNEFQQVEQAQRNFINATLRRESGAVISEAEFDNARKQYFPQPGDKPEVLAQKARNRQTAIQGIGNAAGPAYAKRSTQPTPAAPSRADLEAEARRRGLIQ